MPPEIDLVAIQRGSITAPAGCGKTELITRSLAGRSPGKPVLILTHTNAGVAALRARLKKANISGAAYRLSTIDGFAMRLIGKFPARSGHPPSLLELGNPATDYPAIRQAALSLLTAGHLFQAVAATYDRLWVDEYQDCNTVQHALVCGLASMLPTCVLGDPMQAIFGFGNNRLVNWHADVQPFFVPSGALGTPWRWRNAGTEPLGQWLLGARTVLEAGGTINLRAAPPELKWVQLTAGSEAVQRMMAARTNAPGQGTVLVIGDSMNVRGRHQLTSQTPGAMAVEAVDLKDLVAFARIFNPESATALRELAEFAGQIMTGVGAPNLLTRVASLQSGRAKNPPTGPEAAAMSFETNRTLQGALQLINALANHVDTRVYRPEILHCCRSAMESAVRGEKEFLAAALHARERNRHTRSSIARRAVGSTLLLKGLEADVAIILEPEVMSAQHLYVALTRGAKAVVVCSSTPLLTPR
ncbi:ATP-dependent helicase/nuclease subunit A [Xanthomonas arboricola pv. juglandis]|uniref:UvrD-helicase domain-containing protein n=1 Tax=Xanthomonas TaxID=338 RepID=UPI000E5A61BF|nr:MULTISPECIES: UvrD-helicase domain-containing protein [Xanthomonas]MEB2124609.1 UvrD-helicase domain-containing protein [Xanthomonas campestris pv. campestris]CAD1789515.1 UvrD-helicase domain-containing protein [Xanthomonas sp. CPBF 426]CAG2086954.1 UvrD-helicase domain-containing protein [Xanthomonas euroxanthea]SYZ54223.1 ATP-dependent helicase/nuclease subunit A [Xanthomonas arboricola pv. juglandis]